MSSVALRRACVVIVVRNVYIGKFAGTCVGNPMRWFGFGFNLFGQICVHNELSKDDGRDTANDLKIINPTELHRNVDKGVCGRSKCWKTSQIRASWSGRVSLHVDGDSYVSLAGFGDTSMVQSSGCKDTLLSETHLTLSFPDRIESWDLQKKEKTPAWSMEIKPLTDTPGPPLSLPLVPGGYIATKPPFYHSLSPHLKAKSLALGAEHAILLSVSGAVYTWGLGSHGQLGHGSLTSEEEPRAVEALWGMPMKHVVTGGWHCACISDGADLYIWGWNESGQLGLPSQSLRKEHKEGSSQQAAADCQSTSINPGGKPLEGEKDKEVFISIQAFPALLDISPSCEIRTVSCGSRHTAAVTATGDLYTWGWGKYGQLGHKNLITLDEPQCVEFFKEQKLCVVDVVCGPWNTFTAVHEEEVKLS